jgi:hypothetical protein
MTPRSGLLIADMAGALAALALLGALVVGATAERRSSTADEARAAALETAQNLLDAARHGAIDAPAGWRVMRRTAAAGLVEVRVDGMGITLATLVPAAPAQREGVGP